MQRTWPFYLNYLLYLKSNETFRGLHYIYFARREVKICDFLHVLEVKFITSLRDVCLYFAEFLYVIVAFSEKL